jgi:hypothetical protein
MNKINLTIELTQKQIDSLLKDGSCIYSKGMIFVMIERKPIMED